MLSLSEFVARLNYKQPLILHETLEGPLEHPSGPAPLYRAALLNNA